MGKCAVPSHQDAFLSYTRLDNEFFGGAITSLRKFLELGVQVVTGNRNFSIFQDVDGIEFGQNWQKQLDQAISGTRFLIPIITPLFFQSGACRNELEKFIAHERERGRDDLILPVYFVTTPLLESSDFLKKDLLASEISDRQRYDWRSRADLPINDPLVRSSIRELSEKIAAAISRTQPIWPEAVHGHFEKEEALRAASEAVKLQESPRGTVKKSKKILWVDDRPDNNAFERKAMEEYNIVFTLALSTKDALEKLGESHFDAIISDMGRPPDPRAGYTLLGAVRSNGSHNPFLIYAGSDSPKHLSEALSRGAQGSTNKPAVLITNVLEAIGV